MKIPYKAIHLEDADIFSLDGIHKKYWKDFHDTCHTRIGFSPKIEGADSYENRFLQFKLFRIVQAEYLKWDAVMNWSVKEEDLERFKTAFDLFCKLETEDHAALPMLLVLLRMQQSISKRFEDDIQIMKYIRPRICNIAYDKYRITYLRDLPDDGEIINDLPPLEKKILSGLKNEREWNEDWQYCLKHAKDVRKKGSITEVESAGSVSRDLAVSIIDSYNQSLSNFVAEYSSLNIWFMLDQYSTIHAIVYRLFMSYMVSYPEVKKIFDEYPDNLGVKKLLETRSSLIKEFLQCELGQHWYNCILQDNGLELMGRFLVNHQDNITEEEEYHFLFLLDEICLITDILTGKEQAGDVVDVNNENKNVVVHNITINVKKETNIEHNYENGAQHNDHSRRLTLNSDDADKGKLLE